MEDRSGRVRTGGHGRLGGLAIRLLPLPLLCGVTRCCDFPDSRFLAFDACCKTVRTVTAAIPAAALPHARDLVAKGVGPSYAFPTHRSSSFPLPASHVCMYVCLQDLL